MNKSRGNFYVKHIFVGIIKGVLWEKLEKWRKVEEKIWEIGGNSWEKLGKSWGKVGEKLGKI